MSTLQDSWAGSRPLSAAAERRMFARLRLPGGIFKTTSPGRLTDVDAATVAALPPGRRVAAIDVGASSGTTSLELLDALQAAGHVSSMTISDLSLTARQLGLGTVYDALVDGEGRLLQHHLLGWPIRPWRRRLDYITQFWLVTGALNRWHAWLVARGDVQRALPRAARVLLVAPGIAGHPGIACEEGDVFAPPPVGHAGSFDVVRAANLLIPEVFPAERIAVAIAHLKARLRGPGALLILARSPPPGRPGGNRATIYRLGADGTLAVAARVGGGSDLEALAGA